MYNQQDNVLHEQNLIKTHAKRRLHNQPRCGSYEKIPIYLELTLERTNSPNNFAILHS